ncbi:Golgi CORVET complex core vacuolar protein 8-domain-containing protein [Mycotypha africana]|uniref:Golgi CORVET complex core vacuolar protein 8-domain-containing protein n=1 Tax=Mycotypha africana TaxID=64632 RepID=UPI0023017BD5|nr:Golgi CORVET complex core vacuolar protein 8-domain-containing protein [Mycotypha africana]KAI8991762.1 Golgi CORVET complex core vacuolar protein 8-domain-containing protein [Mycotypha africana]
MDQNQPSSSQNESRKSLFESDVDNNNILSTPTVEPSVSTSTSKFRRDYDTLLREVLEDTSKDDVEQANDKDAFFDNIDIDVNAATAELPEDLRAALEDRALADKYLANLKNFMSHRRSQSFNSEYSTPNTPMQPSFSNHSLLSPHSITDNPIQKSRHQPLDPLMKVLSAIPYHTRLINGVSSLTTLEQKFHALRIPELDLPAASDSVIQTRLNGLYKIRDDLFIHLNGGPLGNNTANASSLSPSTPAIGIGAISDFKKQEILDLLDETTKEIGLYEEFLKKANYLSLESILHEASDNDDDDDDDDDKESLSETINETGSSLIHFDTSSDLSKYSTRTPSFNLSFSARNQTFLSSPPLTDQMLRQKMELSPSISRQSSLTDLNLDKELQTQREANNNVSETWEAFKWTPLIKISDQIYSEEVKREHGLVTVITVSGLIAIGTTRSLVFVYNYSQNLKCILGDTSRALELGSVTSLAVSADHTTIACGHSEGYILVWDIKKPANPIRTIDPISANQVAGVLSALAPQQQMPRKEGHVKGASILHIGFVGVKRSEIVSGDDQGMAFYHSLYKVLMVNAVDTTRILGRYQNLSLTPEIQRAQNLSAQAKTSNTSGRPSISPKPRKPSTVFVMQPLPLGQIAHPAENFGLVALLTPYKMIIVGLKPTPQTMYKFLKPKIPLLQHLEQSDDLKSDNVHLLAESISGCISWLPATKVIEKGYKEMVKGKDTSIRASDPMLAFSWGKQLFILRVLVENEGKATTAKGKVRSIPGPNNKKGRALDFVKISDWECAESIVGIQWINRQILVLFTANEEMILFDPKNMIATEHTSIRTKHLVYHDWFNNPLKEMLIKNSNVNEEEENSVRKYDKNIEMAYFGSIKCYKGKLFLLGTDQIFVGTLLSWADRILALVQTGDFLESISLATAFYNGVGVQTVIGLPEDEKARKAVVGERLMELLSASLNYTFSMKQNHDGMTDEEVAGGETVLVQNLARACIEACLSMNNTELLFDIIYERYFAEYNAEGIFLEVLAPSITADRIPDVPPSVMKDLVDHYSRKRLLDELEQVIWHVNPQNLDINQVVSMCHREGMYEAMMYVWNKSMHDYVSPLVEMLKVIRTVLRNESKEYTDIQQNADKLFDYLKLILTGRSFPDGAPMSNADEASDARSALYSFVFSGRCVVWPPVGGKLILTADEEEGVSEPTYPYLRLLLRFNTKKFLQAMEVSFEDPWLNGGEDILSSRFEDEVPGKVISRQIIVNTLLDVMGGGLTGNGLPLPPPRPKQSFSASTVTSYSTNRQAPNLHFDIPSSSSSSVFSDPNSPPSSAYDYLSNENIILLYIFIASNLHMYTTFILLPPKTLNKILVRLAEDHDPDTRAAREQAVQKLLTVYTPANEEHVVRLFEEAGFWKVLEDIYRRDKKYGKLVEAYLKDDDRRKFVFDCVESLLSTSSELNTQQKEEVIRFFLVRISQIVEIDGQKAAYIVQNYINGEHGNIIHRLEEDQEFDDEEDEHYSTADKLIFSYLKGLIEPTEEQEKRLKDDEVHRQFYKGTQFSHVDSSIIERYVELLCRFDPSGVYNYLNTRLDESVSLTKLHQICEKYNVVDAVVWIMEKSGDVTGALEKMLNVARGKNATILRVVNSHQSNSSVWTFEDHNTINSCLIGLNGVLRVSIGLCENSGKAVTPNQTNQCDLDELPELSREGEDSSTADESTGANDDIFTSDHIDETETLWFRLLDAYVEGSIDIYNVFGGQLHNKNISEFTEIQQRITSAYKSFVQSILTSLLLSTSQVSLPRLLLRLIHSQANGETTFADFRDIFLSMLDTYKYEGKLLELTNRLFDQDLFGTLHDLVAKRERGWRPSRTVCESCGESILNISLLQPSLAWGFDDENDKELAGREEVHSKEYILFHCGHIFHKQCLNAQLGEVTEECSVCQYGNPQAEVLDSRTNGVLSPITPDINTISISAKNHKGKGKAIA